MTHFLARLAERARGTALRVEPLIVSDFAPSDLSGIDTVSEITTEIEAPAAATPTGESKPPRATPPPRESKSVPPRAGQALVQNTPQSPPAETLDAGERKIEIVPEPLLIPQPPTHSQALVVGHTQIEHHVLEHSSERAVLEKQPAKPKTRRLKSQTSAQQPLSPDHVAFSFAPEPRDQAPIVRVTIGRIDVRAAPSPAPPTLKPRRPVGPTLTLDAYLKERKEGLRR
jgi:hypothetical protein